MAAPENKPIQLTVEQFSKIFGGSSTSWYELMWKYMQKYDITNVYRASMFFGNLSIESNNFKTVVENLNYSAEGLVNTFPSKFKSLAQANAYARQPQKIANYVYANKNGNGSESSGDGWKYRGQGPIQITGKGNVAAFHRSESGFNSLSNPSVLQEKEAGAASSCWFWSSNGLNRQADSGNWDVCVRRINAASLHKDERTAMYKRALAVLSGQEVEDLPESGDATLSGTPDARISGVREPKSKAAPQYPFNKVYQSQAGHLIEVDDTPGAERIHIFHMSGSYIEFNPDGDIIIKAHKDLFLLAGGSVQKLQKEDQAEIVEGQSYEKTGSKVISNQDMTIESSNFQVNAPMSIAKPVDAKQIDVQELSCSAEVAQLNSATAEVAKFANAFAPGTKAASSFASLSESLPIKQNDNGENTEVAPTVPVNISNGLIVPTLKSMPSSYNGLFIFNNEVYLGSNSSFFKLSAVQNTGTDNGGTGNG